MEAIGYANGGVEILTISFRQCHAKDMTMHVLCRALVFATFIDGLEKIYGNAEDSDRSQSRAISPVSRRNHGAFKAQDELRSHG